MRMPKLVYSADRRRAALSQASDLEILAALREGEEAALDELVERKTQPLIQAVYRLVGDLEEARDIVQVTLLKVWENREKFDPRWSPNTWIFRIATNLAIDHLRSRRTRERVAEPVRVHLRQVASGQSEHELSGLQHREVMQIFQRLAGDLTDKQRAVFVLREIEERPSHEVAAILGCRESTVRNHLFNARKVLRRELLKQYPEYAGSYGEPELEQEVAL